MSVAPKPPKNAKKEKVDPNHPFAQLERVKREMEAKEAAKTTAARETAAKQTERSLQARLAASGASGGSSAASARSTDSWRYSTMANASGAAAADPTADDALSFHRLMSGVTPLDPAKSPARVPKSQAAVGTSAAADEARRRRAEGLSAEEREAEAVRDHLRQLVEGNARFEVSDDGRRVEGRRVDLPPDALRRLRRGVMPIDGQLDLHGSPADEARSRLETFLREKRVRGEKCVLVVHGKGEHSPGGQGVLRGEMAAWLSQGRASEHVAAFASAANDDGGSGAVYVLLRR